MLSTTYYLQQKNKEKYVNPHDKTYLKTMFRVFLILFLIDLIILIFAISCAVKLQIDPMYVVILIVLMFLPGLGFLVQIGVIIYYYLTNHKHRKLNNSSELNPSSLLDSSSASSEGDLKENFRFF